MKASECKEREGGREREKEREREREREREGGGGGGGGGGKETVRPDDIHLCTMY